MIAVEKPSCAALIAVTYPPGPEPMMMMTKEVSAMPLSLAIGAGLVGPYLGLPDVRHVMGGFWSKRWFRRHPPLRTTAVSRRANPSFQTYTTIITGFSINVLNAPRSIAP